MAIHKRVSGTSSTMAVGVILGVVIGLAILLVLSLTLTWLIYSEKIPVSALGYGSMAVIFVSALVGALVAIKRVKRRKLMVAALSGAGMVLTLFCVNALLLGGNYQGGLVTVGLIALGSVLPALIGGKGRKGRRRGFGT